MGANRDSLSADGFDGLKRASAAAGDVPSGSPASLDSTLPPTPLRDLLAADGATIFVLSADPDLTRIVARAGGDQYPIRLVDNWVEVVGAAAARRTHIVLLDADALPVALPDAVAMLHEAAPAVVVLVAAKRDAAQSLMSLLSDRKVHRLLIKPATEAITRLLLDSAVGRYLQLRDQASQTRDQHGLQLRDQHELPAVLIDDFHPRRRYRRPGTSWSTWVLATALIVVTAVGIVVGEIQGVRWREAIDRMIAAVVDVESRSEPQAVEPPGSGRSTGTEPISAPTISAPNGRAVESESASAGTNETFVEQTELAATRSDQPSATMPATTVSSSRSEPVPAASLVEPSVADERGDSPPLATPDASVPSVDQAARVPPPDHDANERSAAERDANVRAAERDANARLAPERDVETPATAETNVTAPAATELDVLLGLIDTRLAVEREDLAAAQRLSEEAFRLGAERASLARLDRELESARRAVTLTRHAERLSAAQAMLRQGRLLDANGEGALTELAALRRERSTVPGLASAWRALTEAVASNVHAAIEAGDFAAARSWASALAIDGGDPARAADLEFEARQAEFLATPIPASDLQLVEAPTPVYPADALAGGDEGWVDVEFIVDRQGRPRDITVIDSRPGRRFVDAAVEAVAGHRYAPFLLDRRIYERRVRVRVRFELQ